MHSFGQIRDDQKDKKTAQVIDIREAILLNIRLLEKLNLQSRNSAKPPTMSFISGSSSSNSNPAASASGSKDKDDDSTITSSLHSMAASGNEGDEGKKNTPHYHFIHSMILPSTIKIQRELKSRKFKVRIFMLFSSRPFPGTDDRRPSFGRKRCHDYIWHKDACSTFLSSD